MKYLMLNGMTYEQESVLSLIRAIVSGAYVETLKADIRWAKVVEEAARQGVQGLCFDALEQLPVFQQINAISVDYLGFSESTFPQIEREEALEERIINDILSPEFSEEKPKGNTIQVICFKTRRFFANRWKRELVYREGIWSQLWHGSIAHLQRFRTIRD